MNEHIRVAALWALAVVSSACVAGTNANPEVIIKGGQIEVHPDPLVFSAGKPRQKIVWKIKSDVGTYKFGSDKAMTVDGRLGAKIEDQSGGKRSVPVEKDDQQIADCVVRPNKRELECWNNLSKPGFYKYTITVQDKDGNNLPPHDPWIMNKTPGGGSR